MNVNYVYIKEQSELERHLEDIYKLNKASLDLETTGLDVFTDYIILTQIGTLEKQYIIDSRFVNIISLKDWMENSQIIKFGVNLRFDYKFLKHIGIEPEGLIDCLIMEQILNAGKVDFKTRGFYSLAGMAKNYLNLYVEKETRNEFINLRGDITEKQLEYAAKDIIVPILIAEKQKEYIVRESLQRIVMLENNAIPAYGDMEYNGVYLNKSKWNDLVLEKVNKRDEFKDKLDDLFSDTADLDLFNMPYINYDSDSQLLEALQKKGYSIPDTAHMTLKLQLPKDISEIIINYREAVKAITSFGDNYYKFINPVTNKIHPKIWQIGAASGRNSIEKPPLQTIKRDSDYRSAFTGTEEEQKIICIDYSGQELRIGAFRSQEPFWIEVLNQKKNLHVAMTKLMTGLDVDKKSDEYALYKNLDFSIMYGAGIGKIKMFHEDLGLECDDFKAESILDKVATAVPYLWKFVKNTGVKAIINGYASSIYGRKRYFDTPPFKYFEKDGILIAYPFIKTDIDAKIKISANIREATNHEVQSCGADMVKDSLIKLRSYVKSKGYKNKVILAVHDEIVQRCNEKYAEFYYNAAEMCMLKAEEDMLPDIVPMVEGKISDKWEK